MSRRRLITRRMHRFVSLGKRGSVTEVGPRLGNGDLETLIVTVTGIVTVTVIEIVTVTVIEIVTEIGIEIVIVTVIVTGIVVVITIVVETRTAIGGVN